MLTISSSVSLVVAPTWQELSSSRSLKSPSRKSQLSLQLSYADCVHNLLLHRISLITFTTRLIERAIMDAAFINTNYVGKVFHVWFNNILTLTSIVLIVFKPTRWAIVILVIVIVFYIRL